MSRSMTSKKNHHLLLLFTLTYAGILPIPSQPEFFKLILGGRDYWIWRCMNPNDSNH
jgi:hypothetical protein